jgi:hypothetical protein
MCCFFTVLIFLGPRFAGIVWWIIQPDRWVGRAFDSAIWPILGLIFLPWTTLMYVAVAADPLGVNGFFEWAFLILAVIIDVSAYAGGGIFNRDKVPGM